MIQYGYDFNENSIYFIIDTDFSSLYYPNQTFRLKKLGFNFADLAFPILVFEYYLITSKTFTHSFLPRLGLALSILAIFLVFFFLLKKRSFYYPKFIKFFWRAGFLLTFVMYIEMVLELFIQ